MLQKEQIFHLIRQNKAPYWKLLLQDTPWAKPTNIANYFGDNVKKGSDDEDPEAGEDLIEASLNALNSQLSTYDNIPGLQFKITMQPKKNSNQGSILGPFTFALTGGNFSQGAAPQNNGLAGIPGQSAPPAGYVQLGQIEAMITNATAKTQLEFDRKLFEKEKADWEEEKKECEAELRLKYQEYSDVYDAAEKAAKKGTRKVLIEALNMWADGKPGELGKIAESEKTEEEKIIQPLIDVIMEQGLDLEGLKVLVDTLIKVAKPNNKGGSE